MSPFSLTILGYIIQGIIGLGVGWAIKKLGEVHTLVNSRAAAQDAKIATLQQKVDDLHNQLGTQSVTLASERAATLSRT